MDVFARFDENSAMTLQDIKETKLYGRTHGPMYGRTYGHTHDLIRENFLSSHSCRFVNFFSEPNSFMHMFNVFTLYRQSIKLFHQKLCRS